MIKGQTYGHINDRTTRDLCDSMINSQWGKITYLDWCYKEADRINKSGSDAVVKIKDGVCWLARSE